MIKQATIYKAISMPDPEFKLVAALKSAEFQPCLPSQETSSGWTAPDKNELCECINGQLIMQYTTESKKIPADALKRAVEKRCKEAEQLTGRKPSGSYKKEIKQEVINDMILKAFPSRVSTKCWINPIDGMAVIDAAPKRAAEVATALVQSIKGLGLEPLGLSPSLSMRSWLTGVNPKHFDIGIDCELVSTDESKTKVKYVKHNLGIPEIVDHITKGMIPKSIGLTCTDQISFILNSDMSIKQIEFLDQPEIDDASAFEADAFIATTAFNQLISNLVSELS